MAHRIILVSDDKNFFEYIKEILSVRFYDELNFFSFEEVKDNIGLAEGNVVLINSEGAKVQTLDLLKILKSTPIIVSAYNEDNEFMKKCYKLGVIDYISLLISNSELNLRIIPALSVATLLKKNEQYRNILVKNKVLATDREVYLNYEDMINVELEKNAKKLSSDIIVAISPKENTKKIIQANYVESILLNNLRRDDVLMSYAHLKYFIIMHDLTTDNAKKVWEKINSKLPQKFYAGICVIKGQTKQQLINEVLAKLHEAINYDKDVVRVGKPIDKFNTIKSNELSYSNFKFFRQEFEKKIQQVITPVFYQIQQKYTGKLSGVLLQQGIGEGYGKFYIKDGISTGCFSITSPGFSKINIDITCQKGNDNIDAKRISLEPEELEQGLLEDLLEQFIQEYKKGD